MTVNGPDEIIDAEIVEDDHLPAVRDASNSEHIELPNRQDALLAGNPERRCVATNSRGERCRKFAIYGSTVCRTHGGATKHVKQAARIRVENAQNKLMGKLIEFAFDDTKPPDVQLRAIRDALDRGGLRPPAEVVLSQGETKPYERVFDVIGGNPSDAVRYDDSAGDHTSPAPAYGEYSIGGKAEAGEAQTPYGSMGYNDAGYPAAEQAQQSADSEPPRQGRPCDFDRERRQEPHELHITGEAAMRLANQANLASGALRPPLELESPHKRYRRP